MSLRLATILVLLSPALPVAGQEAEPSARQVIAQETASLEEASLDVAGQIAAHARIGRAERRLRRTRRSRQAFEEALTLYDRQRARDQTLADRVRVDIAEARFERAEGLREADDTNRLRMPRGAMDLQKFNRWASQTFGPWLTRRASAIRAIEAAYRAVYEMGPSPWSVAAARRVGDMHFELAAMMERLPTPRSIRRDPQLLAIYQSAISDQAAPLRQRARAAYEVAVSQAEELSLTSEHVTHCREQLAGPSFASNSND